MASTSTGTSSSPSAAAAAATTTTATNILPRIVTLSEIETITSQPSFQKDLIAAISDGFVAYHQGDFFAAPIQTLGVSPPFGFQQNQQGQGGGEEVISNNNYAAQTCVKSGYFRNNPYYVIKVASGGYPFAINSGNMQVYSQQTGRLQAILLDEGLLTELRTAAIGALAFTLLAPAPRSAVTCIGMVGTGVQARFQLQWLTLVTDCRNLILYGRSPEKVQVLQAELEKSGWTVVIASQADDLLSQCDVIITTTSARQAILGRSCTSVDWFTLHSPHRTRLIICIGADAPGKKELAFLLVEQAHVLVADCLKQTRERGEFRTWCRCTHAAAEMGELEKLFSLGQILAEQRNDLLRNNNKNDDEDTDEDNRLYIFDSSGVALQDCVISQMVYEALSTGPSSSS
jgi:ornithine cyclodeaminase/alanine dehydrogenase-like protein (mu-crystallin family)